MRNYIVDMKFPFKMPCFDDEELETLRENCRKSHDYNENYGVDLGPEWVSESAKMFFARMGYYITGAEYFYFAPNAVMNIHIDGAKYCRKAKFNWAWGGEHTFRFFEPLTSGSRDGISDQSSEYSWGFTDDEVELKEEAPIGLPSMCTVGVPHQVINGSEPLELFNITVWKNNLKRDNDDLGGMDFEDGLRDFKDYVL